MLSARRIRKDFKMILLKFITFLSIWTSCILCQNVDPGSSLFLTQFIKEGQITQAREAALVTGFEPQVKSYSGYITINESSNANIFFWYFPQELSEENVPIILNHEGGPGLSNLLSVFAIGPWRGSKSNLDYTPNPFSWHKKYHMLFVDNPIDVGFSFSDREEGYPLSTKKASRDMYEFLKQFFTLFPQLQGQELYTSGGSFGATYSIETAHYIHEKNQEGVEAPINLKGVMVDSPWIGPYYQIGVVADVWYNFGLIGETQKAEIEEIVKEAKELIIQEKYLESWKLIENLIEERNFDIIGYDASSDVYNETPFYSEVFMDKLLQMNSTRKAIHVGSKELKMFSDEQKNLFDPVTIRSVIPHLNDLLKAGIRFLATPGNMEVICGPAAVQEVLKQLTWEPASELISGTRKIWKDENGVVGYVTTAGNNNATLVIIRNAGHLTPYYQNERVFHAIDKFIRNDSNWEGIGNNIKQ